MADAGAIRLPEDTGAQVRGPARSLAEVRSLISRIGKKLRRRMGQRRAVEAKMKRYREELVRLGERLADTATDQEMQELADRVCSYCEANQKKLEEDAGGRTISFESGGKFGWRDAPLALEVTDQHVLLESIRKARLARELITYEPKIDLARIKKDPELLKRLKGIRAVEKTMFRIEPAETDERLETESGTDAPRAWLIKQPKSRVFA